MFPDVFQYSIHIPARLSSKSGLFRAMSTISQSLDRGCNKTIMLLFCSYLYPLCTEEGIYRELQPHVTAL